MEISEAGLDLIKRYEGLRLYAYQDSAGKWTIGYGHTKGVYPGMYITKDQADAFLKEDVQATVNAVNKYVINPLTQSMFDALCSLTFNIGGGAFSDSTLLNMINLYRYLDVPEQFCRWKFAGGKPSLGLLRRRVDEAKLFLKDGLP